MNTPAFPAKALGGLGYTTGMTLRDYFAAQAMMAMIAHPDSDGDKPPVVFANAAYVMADAMLKARGE